MGAYYGKKILNGAINSKTGLSWTIGDVPNYWKVKTQKWLDEHAEK